MKSPGRIVTAAVGAAVSLSLATACGDQVETHGENWVFYPDVQMHREAQLGGEIQYHGLCSNGAEVWWGRSAWINLWHISQGQSIIVSCQGGWPTGGDAHGVAYR